MNAPPTLQLVVDKQVRLCLGLHNRAWPGEHREPSPPVACRVASGNRVVSAAHTIGVLCPPRPKDGLPAGTRGIPVAVQCIRIASPECRAPERRCGARVHSTRAPTHGIRTPLNSNTPSLLAGHCFTVLSTLGFGDDFPYFLWRYMAPSSGSTQYKPTGP